MYQYKKCKSFFWRQALPSKECVSMDASKAPTSWMECMCIKLWMMRTTIETESFEGYLYELVKVSTKHVCMYYNILLESLEIKTRASGVFFYR